MLKTILVSLLLPNLAFAQSCPQLDPCRCYNQEEVKKIAGAIGDLGLCKLELASKTMLINEKMLTIGGEPQPSFWQEPSVIVSGVVVSFALGSIVAFYVLKSK